MLSKSVFLANVIPIFIVLVVQGVLAKRARVGYSRHPLTSMKSDIVSAGFLSKMLLPDFNALWWT